MAGVLNWMRRQLGEPEEGCVTVEVQKGFFEVAVDKGRQQGAAKWLAEYHRGHFMVWSLVAEVDEELFENSVQNISSCARESPRLEDLLRICAGFRSWLEADEHHIVVLLSENDPRMLMWSTLLCCAHQLWSGEQDDARAAFMVLCGRRVEAEYLAVNFLLDESKMAEADPMTLLLAPSHRTYLGYVEQLARQPVLATPDAVCVQRIILHSIPRVGAQGCFPVIVL
ncbi:hypothetical protein T484DRAFT_1851946 [Baffinella frigidus]|nr:hypothetical protein T484DRAFT_1851946 [Cryptophyta sp. CCMP2293]